MAIHITIHDIVHTRVRDCTSFVTVEFTTSPLDTVTLFFPDHAAVQAMIAELVSASDAFTESHTEEATQAQTALPLDN